jgi:hypothetical protein
MSVSPEHGRLAAEIEHNRDVLRYIILPMIGVGALILVGILIVILLPSRLQVSIISDWLFSVLFLCPLVLCLFPVSIGMVLAVVGMNRAQNAAVNPLHKLINLSESVKNRTVQTTDAINQQTVSASTKFAFIDRLLAVFDPPSPPPDEVNKEE